MILMLCLCERALLRFSWIACHGTVYEYLRLSCRQNAKLGSGFGDNKTVWFQINEIIKHHCIAWRWFWIAVWFTVIFFYFKINYIFFSSVLCCDYSIWLSQTGIESSRERHWWGIPEPGGCIISMAIASGKSPPWELGSLQLIPGKACFYYDNYRWRVLRTTGKRPRKINSLRRNGAASITK